MDASLKSCCDALRVLIWPQVGFDYVANAAEEAKDPAKDLPWGIVGSLGIATLLYVLMSLCIVSGWLPAPVPLLPDRCCGSQCNIADTCPANAMAHRPLVLACHAGIRCQQQWSYPETNLTPAYPPQVMMVPYQNIDVNAPFSAAFLDHGMAWAAKIVSLGAVLGEAAAPRMGRR